MVCRESSISPGRGDMFPFKVQAGDDKSAASENTRMKKYALSALIISVVLINSTKNLQSAGMTVSENNSIAFTGEIIERIIKDPSGKEIPDYLEKLTGLAPAAGRDRISSVLKEAVTKLQGSGKSEEPLIQLYRICIDTIMRDYSESGKHFSVIRKWNRSGPWKIYGRPDIGYQFQPEKVYKTEDIEKGKDVTTDESGTLFPFRYDHRNDETVYATSSFESSGKTVLWLQSDAGYKLIINGREIFRNENSGRSVVRAFVLSGARGYTIQLKLESGPESISPRLRCLVTDEKNNPFRIAGSGKFFTNNFTAEKVFAAEDTEKDVIPEAQLLTGSMRELVCRGGYRSAYSAGLDIVEKFPFYWGVYNELIPLLDLMNRDEEFFSFIGRFRKNFPDSDICNRWLADFYMTRDSGKFKETAAAMRPEDLSVIAAESYFYMLCGEKRYSAAVDFALKINAGSRLSRSIPDAVRESGDYEGWRKKLLSEAAAGGDPYFYYALGLSEIRDGLDPVMYWDKGGTLDEDRCLMRDLSDIYENGILADNDFYTGQYTDMHPEFGSNAKKRKIVIDISESGRVFLTGEDIIPSGKKIKAEKTSGGLNKFSDGGITASVPYFKGVKILYVLTAKDGLPVPVQFSSKGIEQNRLAVSYKCSGDEEFSVIRYSGEPDPGDDIFSLVKDLVLKNSDEEVSQLEYEVIYRGDQTPLVNYNGKPLAAGKRSDGVVKFETKERFSGESREQVISGIFRFSSDKAFALWYRNVIAFSSERFNIGGSPLPLKEDLKGKVDSVHFSVMSSVAGEGSVNFNPRKMQAVLSSGRGTVEEKTLLARNILEKNGIISYVSFTKNRRGLIEKILLYVPENRNRGYWLDFYGEGISNNMESGSEALVITGEGYQTFKVNPETCIR